MRLAVIATAAGAFSGLFGVGGGTIIVPLLVAAPAIAGVLAGTALQQRVSPTSLVAIALVALVGTARQREYGNVRLRDGLAIGLLAPVGVMIGVVVANAVPERALELSFAGVQLAVAWQLAGNAGLR